MEAMTLPVAMMVLLQIKHFAADYAWQPGWMLAGKGRLSSFGGYAHAGTHALGSIPALALADLQAAQLAAIVAAEFVVHYAIDHAKAELSRVSPAGPDRREFWMLHGADQMMHHLTYAGMILAAT